MIGLSYVSDYLKIQKSLVKKSHAFWSEKRPLRVYLRPFCSKAQGWACPGPAGQLRPGSAQHRQNNLFFSTRPGWRCRLKRGWGGVGEAICNDKVSKVSRSSLRGEPWLKRPQQHLGTRENHGFSGKKRGLAVWNPCPVSHTFSL